MNGKLIFGNFVPYETCDVSCMVNVDGGNDVGFMLIKDVPSKSVLDICKEIQTRGKNIRPKGGDEVHKKRGRVYNLLPSFLIGALKVVGVFITSHFGINLNFLGLAKDAFGCVIVTSVGNFGYTDAYGCFVGTTGQAAFVTVNAVHEAVVAVNGKPEVAQVVNINWAIDHRYLYSGGRG
jgi:pyruvate dehydrogenase E2 component (dihydrolipoamide acetyltransferase)